MKSVIQEASSLFKAIEKAWEKAGKPTEFTVKILEEAQRNFLGLTTKQAKISLMFQQTGPRQQQQRRDHGRTYQSHAPQRQQRPAGQQSPREREEQHEHAQGDHQQRRRPQNRRRRYGRRPEGQYDRQSGQSQQSPRQHAEGDKSEE